MEQGRIPKWQRQVEAIIRKQFQGDEFAEQLKAAQELITLTDAVEPPRGHIEQIVAVILKHASEELYPLAGVYAAFQLGVAYERYQNANRA